MEEDSNSKKEGKNPERSKNFKCEKCGYQTSDSSEILNKFGLDFCEVCYVFAPNDPEQLDQYIEQKIPYPDYIDTFRPYAKLASNGDAQKKGMIQKASTGLPMSRAPFGYRYSKGKLVPAENFSEVEEIFTEFLETKINLTRLAKKHQLSVNGLKKILTNFTYVGKVKFDGNIYNSNHKPLISSTLFNHVQNKLEYLGIKRIS